MGRVRPYDDPADRSDRTLERITPLLVEIAKEGYNDVPAVLRQFRGMDADGIATELENRVVGLRDRRERGARRGLGRFGNVGREGLPDPEMAPAPDTQTTSGVWWFSSPAYIQGFGRSHGTAIEWGWGWWMAQETTEVSGGGSNEENGEMERGNG